LPFVDDAASFDTLIFILFHAAIADAIIFRQQYYARSSAAIFADDAAAFVFAASRRHAFDYAFRRRAIDPLMLSFAFRHC
jgi:hypothetical protein